MTHSALLAPLFLAVAGVAGTPTLRAGCPSAGEPMIESVLSREGPSTTDAWTLAGCFWPEMTAALREFSPPPASSPIKGEEKKKSPSPLAGEGSGGGVSTSLDTAIVELVRLHVRHSLASEKPTFPDSSSAARKLFALLLEARPPAAGTVVALMAHSTLHDPAWDALREHLSHPDVVRELAAVLADPVRRNDAVTLLNLIRGRDAVYPLMDLIKHPDEMVRGEIAWLLGRTGAAEALPPVSRALKDESPSVRYNAVWALSLLPRPQSAFLARSALKDTSPVVRRAAAAVAGRFLDREALPPLHKLITQDPEPRVREEASYALEFIEDPSSTPFLLEVLEKDPDPLVRAGAAGALLHFPKLDVVPALEKAAHDPDERVRMRAEHVLAAVRTLSAQGALLRCRDWLRTLTRAKDPARLAMIEKIAVGQDAPRVECLTLVTPDHVDPALASLAGAAAAYRGDSTAMKTFGEDIVDPSFRNALFHFMKASRNPSPRLAVKILQSGDGELHRALAPLLAGLDDPVMIEPLFMALSNPELHSGAHAALVRWSGKTDHIPTFIRALERPEHRKWAAEILQQVRNPAIARELEKSLAHPMLEVREAIAGILGHIEDPGSAEPLAQTLRDASPTVRSQAAMALGNLKQPAAIPRIVEALKDKEAPVRREAAWALARTMREGDRAVENPAAIEFLRAALADPSPRVRDAAAGAFMILKIPRVVPDLDKLLKDSDANVRLAAVWALAELRTPDATEAIVSALSHPDAGLRFRAVQVLRNRMDDNIRTRIEKLKKSDPSPLVRQAAAEALK